MGVGEMLRKMSSREITEWQALLILEREDRLRREADARANRALKDAEARLKGMR